MTMDHEHLPKKQGSAFVFICVKIDLVKFKMSVGKAAPMAMDDDAKTARAPATGLC